MSPNFGSKKVNTHLKITEIDLDFFRVVPPDLLFSVLALRIEPITERFRKDVTISN